MKIRCTSPSGKINDEVKSRIVKTIKKTGTHPPVQEELPVLFNISDKDAQDLIQLLADEGLTVRINESLHQTKKFSIRSRLIS
jgi:hypothetical protein